MNEKIVIALLAIMLFLAGGGSGYFYANRANDRAVIKEQQRQAEALEDHNTLASKAEQEVQQIIETNIEKIVDPTGCLDADNDTAYLNGLLDAENAAKSRFNKGL